MWAEWSYVPTLRFRVKPEPQPFRMWLLGDRASEEVITVKLEVTWVCPDPM